MGDQSNVRIAALFIATVVPAGGASAQTTLQEFCDTVGAYMQEVAVQRAAGQPLEAAIDEVTFTFDAFATSSEDLANRRRITQWDRPLAVFAYGLGDLPPETVARLGSDHCVARNGDVRLAPAPAATAAMAARANERGQRLDNDSPAASATAQSNERKRRRGSDAALEPAASPAPVAVAAESAPVQPARERAPAEATVTTSEAERIAAAEELMAAERAAEQRAADQRVIEQRVAEQRVAEQRVAEQRVAEQRAAEQRAVEQRAAEQRAAEERVAEERRVAEQRAAQERMRLEQQRAARESAPVEPTEPLGAENETAVPQTVAQRSPERSVWGTVLRPFYEFALADGGDPVGTILFTNGTQREVDSGNGLTFAGGLIQRINDQFGIKYTAGYKVSYSSASNADVVQSAIPLDVVPFYRLGDHKLGLGLSLHLSPKVDWDWLAPTTKFDDATGLTLEYAWRRFGFSYTDIDYEADGTSLDASHLSLKYSSRF